jgi:MFS family permease
VTDKAAASPRSSVWRNRDFQLLWGAQVLSTIGTRMTSLAYPLLVLAMTGSPAWAGVVGFAGTLPYLLVALPAGALMDRLDRKRVMIGCEAGRAAALGSVALGLAFGWLTIGQLVVVSFIEGSLFVVFDAGERAALPHLVTAQQRAAALAQNQARQQGADIAGRPLGGVLFTVSSGLPFLADAISYVVSLAALITIRSRFQDARARPATRLRADIGEGLRFVWQTPFLRAAAAAIGGINFAFNALVLVLIVRARELGASAATIGLILGMFGAGGLAGSVIAPRVQRRFPARSVVIAIGWFWAVDVASLIFVSRPILLGVVVALSTLASASFNVTVNNRLYEVTPDHLLARVGSSVRLVAWGTIPLGTLAGGATAQLLGARTTILAVAALLALAALAMNLSPGLRTMDTPVE